MLLVVSNTIAFYSFLAKISQLTAIAELDLRVVQPGCVYANIKQPQHSVSSRCSLVYGWDAAASMDDCLMKYSLCNDTTSVFNTINYVYVWFLCFFITHDCLKIGSPLKFLI